jgi:hypothetical protein
MDDRLTTLGYEFLPSKYSPALGFSGLKVVISGKPSQRFLDVKALHIPTFDGRFYHQTQVTRHELEIEETFKICLGEISLESFRGEHLRAFSFGGILHASIEKGELFCEFMTRAPIFRLTDDPSSLGGGLIADEITDLLAEQQVKLTGHKDEIYLRLEKFDPYQVFLASLVSLQKRFEAIPINMRHERYQKVASSLKHVIQVVQAGDGWDGESPALEDLLSGGSA